MYAITKSNMRSNTQVSRKMNAEKKYRIYKKKMNILT